MPIFLEPGQRYPVVLDCDKDKKPTPTFFAKSLSMRQQQKVAETLDLLFADPEPSKLFDETVEALKIAIVGWENIGVDESTDLRDILTYNEARELLRKVMHNQHLDAEEKKS